MTDHADPAQRRAFLIHYAKISLSEARRRRHQRGFAAWLLKCAQKARREAAQIDVTPAQGRLLA